MRSILLLSTILSVAFAQAPLTYAVIDWNKAPACAKKCTVFTDSEKGCIPPTKPVSSQNDYQACFCSVGALTALYSNTHAVCTDVCTTEADREQLGKYYLNLCTSGTVQTPGVEVAKPTGATTLVVSVSTATGLGAQETNSLNSPSANTGGGTWLSSHWKWVVMLIVIFVAMILSIVIGLWFKRRHRRKKEAMGGNVAAKDNGPAPSRGLSNGSVPPPAQSREMAMNGGPDGAVANGILPPPRSRRNTLTRAHSNTANTTHTVNSRNSGPIVWGPHQNMAASHGHSYSNGGTKEMSAGTMPVNVPAAPNPVYAGLADLPERTYSPVVSRRSSAHMTNHPSALQLDTSGTAHPLSRGHGAVQPNGPPSPVSPITPVQEDDTDDRNGQSNGAGYKALEAGGNSPPKSGKRLSKKPGKNMF